MMTIADKVYELLENFKEIADFDVELAKVVLAEMAEECEAPQPQLVA